MDGFKDSTKMKYMTDGDVGAYKSGGTVKKAMGGAMKSVDKDKNPGLSKLPADVRNKMGYMKKGGVAEKAMGGACGSMKKAMGGTVKMREGGTFKEKGKRATMAEIAAEDRRMAGRPVEGVSTRPTDSSGRRASDADLGRPAVKKVVKKAMGGGMDAKLSKAIGNAKAAMTAAPRAKPTLVDLARNNSPQKPSSGNPLMGGMNRGDIVASKHRGPSMAPAFNNRPMIRRKTGGLSVMPKGKC